jgi:hypothetical protein
MEYAATVQDLLDKTDAVNPDNPNRVLETVLVKGYCVTVIASVSQPTASGEAIL